MSALQTRIALVSHNLGLLPTKIVKPRAIGKRSPIAPGHRRVVNFSHYFVRAIFYVIE